MMSLAIADHMSNAGIKTVAFIGFADAYGEGWFQEFTKAAGIKKIQIVGNERYARTDTSVTGQTLKMMSAKPDAVLIAGSGTPAALPQKALKERGYTGKIYQTHGVANADFLRVGGKDVEGTFLPSGPVLVAEQLPASHPVKKSAMAYVTAYEAAHGKGSVSTFGAHSWDAGVLMAAAVPVALKKAKPGTAEFRLALRDALEQVKEVPGAHGIFSMSGDRSPGPGPARTGDGEDRKRGLEIHSLRFPGTPPEALRASPKGNAPSAAGWPLRGSAGMGCAGFAGCLFRRHMVTKNTMKIASSAYR